MIPRIHVTHPGEHVFGTGNEFVNVHQDVFRHRNQDSPVVKRKVSEDVFVGVEETGLWDGEEGIEKEDEGWLGRERWKWWKIYGMHFLFMWTSRGFEYVSIFLVALAFPESLTATSIRGITCTISGLLCSSAVGNWIDNTEVFGALTTTIILNHMAIVAAYIGWMLWPAIAGSPGQTSGPFSNLQTGALYGFLLFLDVVHDLSAIGNRLCLERNLVPSLIGPVTPDMKYDLTQVNSVIVRLELIVKLVAPALLPLLMSSFASRTGWLLVLTGMTVGLFVVELWLVIKVIAVTDQEQPIDASSDSDDYSNAQSPLDQLRFESLGHSRNPFTNFYEVPVARLAHYFSVPMWPASIAVATLHLTVLAYSATLITYLMEIGFSVSSVTEARAAGALTALAGTIITPAVVKYMRKRQSQSVTIGHDENNEQYNEGKISRVVGFWGIFSQWLCLIPVALLLWNLSPPRSAQSTSSTRPTDKSHHLMIPLLLFAFLSLSRIGHFAVILMVQELGQVEIPASQRSTFAGTEQSFKSFAELCHWGATMILSRPDQFRWLAVGSVMVTGMGTALFGVWARRPVITAVDKGDMYESVALREMEGEW